MTISTLERVQAKLHDGRHDHRFVDTAAHGDDIDLGSESGGLAVHEDDDTVVRRRELLGVGGLVLCAVVSASVRADLLYPHGQRLLVNPSLLRTAAVALAVGFIAYVFAQEHELRAIDARHAAEWSHASVAASRILVAVAVADAVARIHASLLVGDVVATLLCEVDGALALDGAAIRLVGVDGRARRAGAVGHMGTTAEVGAEAVVTSFPLHAGSRRLGWLDVRGTVDSGGREMLVSLADHGARALANARLYEDALNAAGTFRDEYGSAVAHVVDAGAKV